MKKLLFSFVFVAQLVALTVQASLVAWDLNPSGLNAPVGWSSNPYTQSGYTITATGFDNVSGPDTLHDLFYKNGGASETGLGLVNTANNELQFGSRAPVDYIQLNIQSLLSNGFTNGKIQVGSVQAGESFSIYGSATAGSLGSLLGAFGSASDDLFVGIPNFGTYNYISIAAASGDVLPVAFQAMSAPVPEMNALPAIAGLLVVAAVSSFLRRRQVS